MHFTNLVLIESRDQSCCPFGERLFSEIVSELGA